MHGDQWKKNVASACVGPDVREAVDEHVLQDDRQGGVEEGVVESLDVHHGRGEVFSKEFGGIDRVADKMAIEVACVCICVCVCVCGGGGEQHYTHLFSKIII